MKEKNVERVKGNVSYVRNESLPLFMHCPIYFYCIYLQLCTSPISLFYLVSLDLCTVLFIYFL